MADVALSLDSEGRIVDVATWSVELPRDLAEALTGRALVDTLAQGDPEYIKERLELVRQGREQRLDLVHLLDDGALELPVQYHLCASGDSVLAVGMDLRPSASLRQQLVNAQQALEQDYWRLRNVETRYRRLFDMIGDAVLVLDALSFRVLEVNPRGNELLDGGGRGIIGKVFPRGFDDAATKALQALLTEIRTVGRGQLQSLRLQDGETRVDVSASFLRQAGEERFLLRISARAERPASAGDDMHLQEILAKAPDAVLLADEEGRIMAANRAFLDLAQIVGEDQAIGHPADRWIGRSGVDLSVLLANVREKGSVKLFSSTLMPQAGTPAQVEISACRLEDSDGPAFALFVRDIERRIAGDHPVTSKLPSSIEQVTKRVGRVPLKELVRESTDLIEALCIETALEVTQDNRASAAELLGLSRQSLYAKLRRFNIGSADAVEEEE
jgi:transcriptional regulator PpsR